MLSKTPATMDLSKSLANGVIVPDPYMIAQMQKREREMRTPVLSKSNLLMHGITPGGISLGVRKSVLY